MKSQSRRTFCDRISRDIPGDRHQHGINRHLARMANSDLGLKLPRFDVDSGGANHTREIGALNLVRIDENEVPKRQVGQGIPSPVNRPRRAR